MATQAALLYQEAPVGVFLPKLLRKKTQTMPSSTSANRAAITSLIDVFLFRLLPPHGHRVERHHYNGGKDAAHTGSFSSSPAAISSSRRNYPAVCCGLSAQWSNILPETQPYLLCSCVCTPKRRLHTRALIRYGG